MTMHLVGPYLTTTSYKKPKDKLTKAKQEELERGWRERNIRLREMHLPKETFEQYLDWVYGRGKKTKTKKDSKSISTATTSVMAKGQEKIPPRCDRHATITQNNSLSKGMEEKLEDCSYESKEPKSLGLWITGAVSSKPTPTYTGTKVLGIGTMHKSNAVPIFSDEEAIDISKMRR